MSKPLTATCYISINGAEPVLMSSFTPEEKQHVSKVMAERVGEVLSEHYSCHRDEFKKYIRKGA